MPEELLTAERLAALNVERAVPLATAHNGRQYLQQGRVQIVHSDRQAAQLAVRGSAPRPYRVDIRAVPNGGVTVECTCPVFETNRPCKHIVASILFLVGYLKRNPPAAWHTTLDLALRTGTDSPGSRRATSTQSGSGRNVLLFSLQERTSGRWGVYRYSLPIAKLPPGVVQDTGMLWAGARRLSKQATAVRSGSLDRFANLTPDVARAASMIEIIQQGYYGYNYYGAAGHMRHLLPLLAGCPAVFLGTEQDPLQTPVTIELPTPESPARAALRIDEVESGGELRLTPVIARGSAANDGADLMADETPVDLTRDEFLSEDPPWLLMRPADKGGDVPASLIGLEEAPPVFLRLAGNGGSAVPAVHREAFFDRYLLPLAENVPLLGNVVTWEDARTPDGEKIGRPTPRMYLSEADNTSPDGSPAGDLQAQLRFAYGDDVELPFDPAAASEVVRRRPGTEGSAVLQRVRRDPDSERETADLLSSGSFGLKRDPASGAGIYRLRARVTPVDFLLRHVPRLAEAGFEVYGEESLRAVRVNRARPTLSFNVSSGIDWFDVEAVVQFGDVGVALDDLRGALRRRERYVKLADGSLGELPEDWLAKFRHLFALAENSTEENTMRLSATQALLLEQAIADADGAADVDAEFARRLERLKGFEQISPRPLPEGLNAVLYPYQKAGFDWLHFLHDHDFGGCLADDMGLGKTLATLSHLLSLRAAGGNDHAKAPDLVVVPRSLLFNWQREAAKFTPALRILVYADGDRPKDGEKAFDGYDMVLTTYGILLRDLERLRQTRFHYAVLDEAQAIKNPLSQTAQAARLLNAEHRLSLTGTPVENGTLELWSQFAFLNPGLLGSLERFKEDFASAIEREQDESAAVALRRLIAPFLLRRTKEQVASDLPPRTDRSVLVEMEPAQRKLYDKLRDQYRAEVLGLMDGTGTNGRGGGKAQIAILEGLLRLRQVCCHPRLVEPTFRGDSGKMAALLETVETLRAEGHKALIFSQFTKMLGLVKEVLDAKHIPYAYLDGRTRDRQARVDQFQDDPNIPFFLISLKAGGVGLNLTAADYVLHIDPWWNPAVEQQATDRAHRIGQDKPVFVFRYLTKDSVEEKILQLQERKRELVQQLISAETGFFKSLTRDDIEALFS